jgi:hypothetical protein
MSSGLLAILTKRIAPRQRGQVMTSKRFRQFRLENYLHVSGPLLPDSTPGAPAYGWSTLLARMARRPVAGLACFRSNLSQNWKAMRSRRSPSDVAFVIGTRELLDCLASTMGEHPSASGRVDPRMAIANNLRNILTGASVDARPPARMGAPIETRTPCR